MLPTLELGEKLVQFVTEIFKLRKEIRKLKAERTTRSIEVSRQLQQREYRLINSIPQPFDELRRFLQENRGCDSSIYRIAYALAFHYGDPRLLECIAIVRQIAGVSLEFESVLEVKRDELYRSTLSVKIVSPSKISDGSNVRTFRSNLLF